MGRLVRLQAAGPAAIATLATLVGLVACAPAPRPGSLASTLRMEEHAGGEVAIQNGIPVPSFDRQPRQRLELDGTWRVDRQPLDDDLSLTDRNVALDAILAEAAGREQTGFDDRGWEERSVPGALNHPPDEPETGAWYRRIFYVPRAWAGSSATLKAEAMNYVADLWVNGSYLGYHEGGYTPFAFDVSDVLRPGLTNVVVARVDNPAWGSRNDIVPWGLADWWNYGGITRSVWIEATPPTHLVRADVVPHLDSIDVGVVVRRASSRLASRPTPPPATPQATAEITADATLEPSPEAVETVPQLVRVEVLRAEVTPDNLTDPDPRSLLVDEDDPVVVDLLPLPPLDDAGVARLETGFLLGGADAWSPAHPALFVLRVSLVAAPRVGIGELDVTAGFAEGFAGESVPVREVTDSLLTSFGLRHVAVDPETPRLMLNGEPTMFTGVALHDEIVDPGLTEASSTARRAQRAEDLLPQLEHARAVNAELIRTGHTPANPLVLMLADRLGFAVWEEIPLYHYTPLTYGIAMDRGIPQQMLREMALRDMNHPSVLFHGLSNESTGTDERARALAALHEIDRHIDGTRLTGQAAYGSIPDDPTHAPLDVAGFTFYYGVFYGTDAAGDTARALGIAHVTNPAKPILALEFGRWADDQSGPQRQQEIFDATYPQLVGRSVERGGYVAGTVWWTLEDYMTMVPGIIQEHFGLYEASGDPRPAAASAADQFAADAGAGAEQMIASDVRRAGVTAQVGEPDLRLFGYLAYGLGVSLGAMALFLLLLLHRGGRATGRPIDREGIGL